MSEFSVINIVFYTHYPPNAFEHGGGALAIWSTVRALQQSEKVNVTVCFHGDGSEIEHEDKRLGKLIDLNAAPEMEIIDLIRKVKPDVFHAFNPLACKAIRMCSKLGIPTVYEVRSPTCHPCKLRHRLEFPPHKMWRATWAGFLDRRTALLADFVLVPSKLALEPLRRYFDIPVEKSGFAYNGVDHEIFHPPKNKAIKESALRLINAGRVTHGRNFDLTLEIYDKLRNEYPNLALDIVGDGNALSSLKFYAESKGMGNVTFHGSVSHEKLAELYRQADILVNTSQAESFGNVVAEAMSCGLPVVAFSVGSLPEVTGGGACALLAEFSNIDEMVANVRKLIGNSELRDNLRKKAAQVARESYTWEKRAHKISQIYFELLRG